MSARRATCWPTPRQHALLRVAFGSSEESAAAWDGLGTLDASNLEHGSYALLPLVFEALTAAGRRDLPAWLAGVARKTLYDVELLHARVGRCTEVLADAGLEPLVVGGLARAVRWYPRVGLRPTPLAELLVPEEALATASALLTRAGWTLREDDTGCLKASEGDSDVLPVLLRSSTLPVLALDAGKDWASLDATARTLEHRGVRLRVLGPADELLLALAAGARCWSLPSIQWVADVLACMRSDETVDWDRLVARAAATRQSVRARDALDYVRHEHGATIPLEALTALGNVHAPRRERVAYHLTSRREPIPRRLANKLAALLV